MNTTTDYKSVQLKKHKVIATTFFVVMALIYITSEILLRKNSVSWLGYVKAFSEAAMVGALADWFAVTALFHHPLGLKIPHTNLIEERKKSIGDNLGKFVVENFLSPQTIRPYISKIQVSGYAADWLEKEKNRKMLLTEITKIINNILQKIDDAAVSGFIAQKGEELLNKVEINKVLASALQYVADKKEHEKILDYVLNKAKYYVAENEDLVRARVKKESGILVPGFVDNMLANRITVGIANYLHEIEQDPNHSIRKELTQQLYKFIQQLREEDKWKNELNKLKEGLLSKDNIQKYATDMWNSIKFILLIELSYDGSKLLTYLDKNILSFAQNLKNDETMRKNIDAWFRLNAYKLFLKNVNNVGDLISNTVGNWEGNELSHKLELEVGKDLQFIRINGTLVGGLVGLIIYAITQWI
ncbi:hypothetical protein A9P82_00870 [Arachidicoccus ginsenosidimutans]|uniref:DUF445 domain-containing protein n=1 Tax=Arachidicoccus sp. BS20 TaxID=1850526 RepID=UPI0007F05DFF|nr:DUF445 domain-containing protein [Arachidicoccus sp. BS20]ANI87995.1 hypothetical protein A9P82_00870 [Arachidicoccus sp. BS20]